MNAVSFRIQGQTELHQGKATIIESNSYQDLVLEAESAFDGDCTIRKIGSYRTMDMRSAYDIYETYQDSGSVDYYYCALLTSSEPK